MPKTTVKEHLLIQSVNQEYQNCKGQGKEAIPPKKIKELFTSFLQQEDRGNLNYDESILNVVDFFFNLKKSSFKTSDLDCKNSEAENLLLCFFEDAIKETNNPKFFSKILSSYARIRDSEQNLPNQTKEVILRALPSFLERYDSQQLANTLGSLVELGFTKDDINPCKKIILDSFKNKIKKAGPPNGFKTMEFSESLEALVDLGIEKEDVLDVKENILINFNSNLKFFRAGQLAFSLNSIAELGLTGNNLSANCKKNILNAVGEKLEDFDGESLSFILYSLVKLDFNSKDISKDLKTKITNSFCSNLEYFRELELPSALSNLVELGWREGDIPKTHKNAILKNFEDNSNSLNEDQREYFYSLLNDLGLQTDDKKENEEKNLPETRGREKQSETQMQKEEEKQITYPLDQKKSIIKDVNDEYNRQKKGGNNSIPADNLINIFKIYLDSNQEKNSFDNEAISDIANFFHNVKQSYFKASFTSNYKTEVENILFEIFKNVINRGVKDKKKFRKIVHSYAIIKNPETKIGNDLKNTMLNKFSEILKEQHPQETLVILTSMTKLGYTENDILPCKETITNAIDRNLDKFNEQQLSNTLTSMIKLGYTENDISPYRGKILNAIDRNLDSCNPEQLTSNLFFLTYSGFTKDDISEYKDKILSNTIANLDKFNPEQLTSNLHSLVCLGYTKDDMKPYKDNISEVIYSNLTNFRKLDLPITLENLNILGWTSDDISEDFKVGILKNFEKNSNKLTSQQKEKVSILFKRMGLMKDNSEKHKKANLIEKMKAFNKTMFGYSVTLEYASNFKHKRNLNSLDTTLTSQNETTTKLEKTTNHTQSEETPSLEVITRIKNSTQLEIANLEAASELKKKEVLEDANSSKGIIDMLEEASGNMQSLTGLSTNSPSVTPPTPPSPSLQEEDDIKDKRKRSYSMTLC